MRITIHIADDNQPVIRWIGRQNNVSAAVVAVIREHLARPSRQEIMDGLNQIETMLRRGVPTLQHIDVRGDEPAAAAAGLSAMLEQFHTEKRT